MTLARLATLFAALVMVLTPAPAHAAAGAPTISSPAQGASACGPSVDVSGTADPGTLVRVVEGAETLGETTASETGAWTVSVTFASGEHTITAIASDGDTDSAPSDTVSFAVAGTPLDALDASYQRISPADRDGVRDVTMISTTPARSGAIRFKILKGETVVKQSTSSSIEAGALAAWTWSGRGSESYNDARFVSSGRYTAVARWHGSGCTFSVVRSIVVDNIDPTLSSVSDSPGRFYPKEGDELTEFKDFTRIFYVGLSEKARVTLFVYRDGGTRPVRTVDDGWDQNGGAGSVKWNGRRANGDLLEAGRYDYVLRFRDVAGNLRSTRRRSVALSHKVLVMRHNGLHRVANRFDGAAHSECGAISESGSRWDGGVLLYAGDCYPNSIEIDGAMLAYSFKLPEAPYYHLLQVQIEGQVDKVDTIVDGYVYNYSSDEDDFVGDGGSQTLSRTTLGTVPAHAYVAPDGYVDVTYLMRSRCDCETSVAYDVKLVNLGVTYGVLV